ncbi:MAG: ADP-ribosylglycohydrolase family protein [Bacillota bacterium]
MIPSDYLFKLYAGFIGMNIGIRLGAPVESGFWTYGRIRGVYGDIHGYVRDYKHFAADDDTNGPVFFARALEDGGGKEPTPQTVAEAWLNYAREGVGLYWWGGYGVSTEHTAYLNLKNGVPAPQSGSIAQNGKTIAEQIGGQIFIDTWGLVAPADPDRAARYARAAASVSHDGEALNGAAFIAGCISAAFATDDIGAVMDEGVGQLPPESLYAKVVNAVRSHHAAHPEDWRSCYDMLARDWGYDCYGGACHIIPNAGVCALALCYGRGDFARSIEIATMCGWDTDCNAGNVGTILGVMNGVETLPARYREPINDEVVLSGISGYLNLLDIPTYARTMAAWGYRLAGEPVPDGLAPVAGEIDFDFRLPGSTHGLRFETGETNYAKHRDASSGFCVLVDRGVRANSGCKLFYKPFWRRADFDDERYMPVFSPTACAGQSVEMRLTYERMQGDGLLLTPYARETYSGMEYLGEPRLTEGGATTLAMTLPDSGGGLFDEIGVKVVSAAQPKLASCGMLRFIRLRIFGKGRLAVDFAKAKIEFGSVLPFSHNHGAWSLEGEQLQAMTLDHAESVTGNYYMINASLRCRVTPVNGNSHLLGLRVQGARRGYYAGFRNGEAVICRHANGRMATLASAVYGWNHGRTYAMEMRAEGENITLAVDGKDLLRVSDGMLAYGMAALALYGMGRCLFDGFTLEEL